MRYFSICCAFTIGLASGVAGSRFVTSERHNSTAPPPQTEIISILEDEVMSIAFSNKDMTFLAQRSTPGAEFAVQITYADGRPPRQCRLAPSLHGQLAAYATITAKHPLESPEQAYKDFPIDFGTLELRDRITNEPVPLIHLRASPNHNTLAAHYGDVAVEITHQSSTYMALGKSCDQQSTPRAKNRRE